MNKAISSLVVDANPVFSLCARQMVLSGETI